jgi:hypothetical protein
MPAIKYRQRVTSPSEEIEKLESLLHKGKSAPRNPRRARILLKAGVGCGDDPLPSPRLIPRWKRDNTFRPTPCWKRASVFDNTALAYNDGGWMFAVASTLLLVDKARKQVDTFAYDELLTSPG